MWIHNLIQALIAAYGALGPLVAHNWPTILTLLGLGSGTALVVQIIKKLGKLDEAKKTVIFLLGLVGYVVTYADWVVQYANQNPQLVIATHLGVVISVAVFVHRFAVSPGTAKVTSWLAQLDAAMNAHQQEVQALQNVPAPIITAATPSATPSLDPAAQPHEFIIPS